MFPFASDFLRIRIGSFDVHISVTFVTYFYLSNKIATKK